MNSNDENENQNRLFVNGEGSFTSKGIVQIRGHGKLLRTSPEEMERKAQLVMEKIKHPVVLATVQHTGSRFFVSLLQERYGAPWPIYQRNRPFYFDHCRDSNMDSIIARVQEGATLVTTFRPWEDCRISWAKRKVNTYDEFKEQYNNWISVIQPMADCCVSVWAEDRNMLLQDLSTILELDPPLTTDWRVVG